MSNFKAGWHLIYTRPQQERKVSNQLTDWNIQVYLPLKKERRQWSDRVKILTLPVFPSYVFVNLKSVQEYYESTTAEGMCYFVKFGNELARISDTDINYIRMMENNGENIEVTDAYFQVGQQLVIQQGPLSGLTCEVIQYKGKQRILVRIGILQRSIMADLPFSAFAQCV